MYRLIKKTLFIDILFGLLISFSNLVYLCLKIKRPDPGTLINKVSLINLRLLYVEIPSTSAAGEGNILIFLDEFKIFITWKLIFNRISKLVRPPLITFISGY